MLFNRQKSELPTEDQALPGHAERWFTISDRHRVLESPVVTDDVPAGYEVALFGSAASGAPRRSFAKMPGVWSTSVGYAGGFTPHPSYEEAAPPDRAHRGGARVFDPAKYATATW